MKRKGYLLFVFLFTLFVTESNITNGKTLTGQDGIYASSSIAGRKINAEAEPLSVSVLIIDFKTR